MRPRCALYARCSSDNQRDASIEDQIRICNARAEWEGWQVIGTFADAAISGATTQRLSFLSPVEAMRSDKVAIVLAESLDRFSRDLEHVAAFHKQAQLSRVAIITLSEGELCELHVGLKGTMAALYLTDLAAKTHRGQEGRVRKGFACGRVPFGYRAIRRLDATGEAERGLRKIDPIVAPIVRRICRDYAEGTSPMAIARALNAEGVASPSGGDWFPSTIRGRPGHNDGILCNSIYVGRMVWNRHAHPRDPLSGKTTMRRNAPEALVEVAVPDQRIIDGDLWNHTQMRLAAEAAPKDEGGRGAFRDRRRPQHLLTGKVFCGLCSRSFGVMGRDCLGCHAARCGAGCTNRRRVRRARLEARILEAPGTQLMRPELVEAFCEALGEEWTRLTAEISDGAAGRRRELQGVEPKLAHVIDAIADGLKSPELARRLGELEGRRAELLADLDDGPRAAPVLPRDLALVYAERVGTLCRTIGAEGGSDVLEAARTLVDRVVVSPGQGPDDPPDIELVGHLRAMLKAGGAQSDGGDDIAIGIIAAVSSGSAKAGKGEVFLPRSFFFMTLFAKTIGASLRTYYAPGRAALLDAFHARFLAAGDLAFDIGTHVGDRTASFRRLGARVIAVEPQPRLARALRLIFRGDPGVTLVPALVGAAPGEATLRLNTANPTVATASTAFIAAADGAQGWEGQRWDAEITRPVTTLDALAMRHGLPAFVKIDVEGFEAEVLRGLTRPPRALSFEFTTIQRGVAAECLGLLSALGYRAFNACLGETMAFAHARPVDAATMRAWIDDLPHAANSGDVYASLMPERLA